MKVYGILIKFNDGTILRDNFNSDSIGNIIAMFRGNQTVINDLRLDVYPTTPNLLNNKTEEFVNYNGDVVIIPIHKISYIKYRLNSGLIGEKKQKDVYDWEKELKQ